MTKKKTFIHGWKTMTDGSRTPMTEDEANEIWQDVEEQEKRRADQMPETMDALRAFIDADQRLTELKWKKHSIGIEEGTEVAVVENGSTGIFRGVWSKPYFHYADCVSSAGKVWWKPVADLTEAERAWMEKCGADHAAFMDAQMKSFARIHEIMVGGGAPMPPAPEGGE